MNNVKKAQEITGKHVGLMLDTKGAEIRTTVEKDGKIEFNAGDKVCTTTFTLAATFCLMTV